MRWDGENSVCSCGTTVRPTRQNRVIGLRVISGLVLGAVLLGPGVLDFLR